MNKRRKTSQSGSTDETRIEPMPVNSRRNSRTIVTLACAGLLIVATATMLNFNRISALLANGETSSELKLDKIRRMPVRVERIEHVNQVSQKRKYTGLIRAKRQADLGFELTGRIETVAPDEGDFVELGETLASIDVKALVARKAAISANLQRANAVLNELKAGPRQQTIDSMRAQQDEANSNLRLAELNYQRRNKIRRAIAAEEFEQAQYTLQAAQARVDSISKQLEELEAGTRPERIAAQMAAVDELKSTLRETEIQIEKSSIVAPFSGKIIKRLADPGGIATTSMAILTIVDVENLEAVIGLPVDTAEQLEVGDEYDVVISNKRYKSVLKAKIQQLEIATRTQNLIFELDPSAIAKVIPGQLCQIELETKINADGYWVPAVALTNGIRGLWSLKIVGEGSRVYRTDVQLIYTDGDRALVKGTINDQTLVIIEGTHRVVEGQFIDPIAEQARR